MGTTVESWLVGCVFVEEAVFDVIVEGKHEGIGGFEDEEATGFNGVIEAGFDLVEGDFWAGVEAEGEVTGGGVGPFGVEFEVCGVEDEASFFAGFAGGGGGQEFTEVLKAAGEGEAVVAKAWEVAADPEQAKQVRVSVVDGYDSHCDVDGVGGGVRGGDVGCGCVDMGVGFCVDVDHGELQWLWL